MRADVATALRRLADAQRLQADALASLAAALDEGAEDDLVPHTEWPLGSRRRCAELARSGAIAGATRRGKVWLARRSAVEAYAAAGMVPTLAANDSDDDSADDDGMLAAIARHARR